MQEQIRVSGKPQAWHYPVNLIAPDLRAGVVERSPAIDRKVQGLAPARAIEQNVVIGQLRVTGLAGDGFPCGDAFNGWRLAIQERNAELVSVGVTCRVLSSNRNPAVIAG